MGADLKVEFTGRLARRLRAVAAFVDPSCVAAVSTPSVVSSFNSFFCVYFSSSFHPSTKKPPIAIPPSRYLLTVGDTYSLHGNGTVNTNTKGL